ncbi:MAG: hypothetical protein IKD47_02490 [Clostridia bacterium]|nr:hypothetical protein [Clostridia bacterium]
MKRTVKGKLIALCGALAATFLLAGCSFTQTADDFRNENNLVAKVTYFANGGIFENNLDEKTMEYRDGTRPLNIGVDVLTSGSITLERTDYEFVAWHYVEVDENGEPIVNSDGEIVLGEEVDFKAWRIQEDEHWHIAAMWSALSKVKIHLVCDEGETVTAQDGKTYQNGDLITERGFGTQDSIASIADDVLKPVKDTYTFVNYYEDEACTKTLRFPVEKGEKDVVVYAKYLTGVWEIVKESSDVKDMFAYVGIEGMRYYLANDIDCSSMRAAVAPANSFNAEFQGNGYTISNLNVARSSLAQGSKTALFGAIGATARIENVTFENVSIKYTSRPNTSLELYFAFTSIDENAVVNNVTLSGEMNVVDNGLRLNNNTLGDWKEDHWKFGGYALDSEYVGGITVTADSKVSMVEN